jgi:pyruvate formate lyase activating enzyme
MKGIIFDIKRYSIHDGPGVRTTVFFKGCPLRCIWCHNPESQKLEPQIVWYENRCIGCLSCFDACKFDAIDRQNGININKNCTLCGDCVKACPTNALEMIGEEYEIGELANEILKDEKFFEDGGGVTISGGEPFVQHDFLLELLKQIKQYDIHIALDTTGYVDSKKLLEASVFADLFLYDIKLIDSKKHKQYTGVPNELILDNLKKLDRNGSKIAIRIPIIPTINDDDENIEKTIEFISGLKNVVSVDLLPFHSMMADKYRRLKIPFLVGDIKEPSKESMDNLRKRYEVLNIEVNVGG